MGSGYAKKKKEAKMMEQQLMEIEASLLEKRYEGQSGNGLVTIVINGKHEIISVQVQPQCLDPEDPEAIEDLFRAAFQKAKQLLDEDMSTMRSVFPF
ncbi:YbaB/EbfC family nucleoid-associated protein [Chlamydia pecorum]|uniref:YbaB/EbfC family nucleoid-associated protein n=1 Tax=Chlamydia pecorum TaxID=85991 RepID=UPI0007AF69C1|nr:YbaB/EbfC family nucleoid-associated protein [Chlamydia pecorum]KZN26851.1 DNA-binding protein, YbaB/EbfC family [Chlamydia pecorum]